MNMTQSAHQNFNSLKRHLLFVIFICYSPHILTEPWWLFFIFVTILGYRLIADYFNYPILPRLVRFTLVIGCLLLLSGSIHSSQFVIRFLLIFIILKCLEIKTMRDLKVLIICNFFLIFSALIVIQEFWIIIYLLIAILANLSIMLKLSAPQASLRQIGGKSGQQLLIVIPISIVLFYVFPRIDPLWQVPSLSNNSSTGFSERMNFGSISELYNDDSPVMRITFKDKPILDGYWRGILLSYYNGESWNPTPYNYYSFYPLLALKTNELADYEILLEPNQTKWLFYSGYPIATRPNLVFSARHGLIQQNNEIVTKRFIYSLNVQSPKYKNISPSEYKESIQLPSNSNPRLNNWSKVEFAKAHNNVRVFIAFLHDYIHQQPFWYTLTPPTLISNRNQMDNFWFDTQKGFCEHYASAVTYILRAAGIPARVVVGYHGGQWNPISQAVLIQRNNAHAWLEYWEEKIGWQQLDPTSFIAPERIDQTIRNRQIELSNQQNFDIATMPWARKVRLFFESEQFFYDRWFLYYNQNTQQNLFQYLGLGQWNKAQLLQASVGAMILFFILISLGYQWRQKQAQDLLLLEYHLLQKEFRKFNILPEPSSTLKQQCQSLGNKVPDLALTLSVFLDRYEQLRLKQSKENKKETIALFKTLRANLRQHKFSKKPII